MTDKLEFENGKLVKVNGMRPQYLGGMEMIALIHRLAELNESLRTHVAALRGVLEAIVIESGGKAIPNGSLTAIRNRASTILAETKPVRDIHALCDAAMIFRCPDGFEMLLRALKFPDDVEHRTRLDDALKSVVREARA